jgi:hypothetical protein
MAYTGSRHLGFSGSVLWELGMHGQYVATTQTAPLDNPGQPSTPG